MADSLLYDLYGWLRGLVARPAEGGARPPAVALEPPPVSGMTLAAIRTTLDEHDHGVFLRSGLLADLITRDADCFGALQQRLLGLTSRPIVLEPADDSAEAVTLATELGAELPQIFPAPARADLGGAGVLCGFSLAQLYYRREPGTGRELAVVDPWPVCDSEYSRTERQWYAHTATMGRLAVHPGDGQWVLHAPRSKRAPFLWGAIRCTAEWYRRDADAAGDASRQAEVHGIPVWKAKVPSGARKSEDGRAFARAVRGMGRNAVVPLPQGREASESYDLELIEAKSDAYRIFEFLMGRGGRAFRLALLGQDLTSANDKVGTNASSQTGREVTAELVRADAMAEAETLTTQVFAPVARVRRGPGAKAPRAVVPLAEDLAALATTWKTAGDALTTLRGAGVPVDEDAFARKFNVPQRARSAPEG